MRELSSRRNVQASVGLIVLSMGGKRLDTHIPTTKLMLPILAGVATREREIVLEQRRGASPNG